MKPLLKPSEPSQGRIAQKVAEDVVDWATRDFGRNECAGIAYGDALARWRLEAITRGAVTDAFAAWEKGEL